MSKEIKLTKGKIAIVDDEDHVRLSAFKWYARKHGHTFYAERGEYLKLPDGKYKKTAIPMHRMILNPDNGLLVDHKNRNGLDNRKVNLRACSIFQNMYNTRLRSGTSSKYRGVHYSKVAKRWVAQIRWEKNRARIGSYLTETQAALAYNDAAAHLHGEFAQLNIIQ